VRGRTFHWTNLPLAFVLELCALSALCYWGFSVGSGPVTKTALGLPSARRCYGACSRRPARRCPCRSWDSGVKIIVFGSAAAALYATGHRTLAIVFALIVVANAVLIRLGQ